MLIMTIVRWQPLSMIPHPNDQPPCMQSHAVRKHTRKHNHVNYFPFHLFHPPPPNTG